LLNLPFGIAGLQARLLRFLPEPPLTPDQVELLKRDNVVGQGSLGLAELGISPTPLEVIVPEYLRAYALPSARMPVL
jgi:NADH dehydrogenase